MRGIAAKNHLLMQIYADVTNREIKIAASSQTPDLAAAMFGVWRLDPAQADTIAFKKLLTIGARLKQLSF
jgi:L-ribulokinase